MLTTLSPEEKQAIAQMVRSSGWFTTMREFVLPQIQHASDALDIPQKDESHANFHRGAKRALRQLIEQVYHIAELPNPFEKHTTALLSALESYTTTPVKSQDEDVIAAPVIPENKRSHRVSFPV